MNWLLILSFQVGYTEMTKHSIKATFFSNLGCLHYRTISLYKDLQTYTRTLMFASLSSEIHLLVVSHPTHFYMYFHRNNWFHIFHFTVGKGPYLFLD